MLPGTMVGFRPVLSPGAMTRHVALKQQGFVIIKHDDMGHVNVWLLCRTVPTPHVGLMGELALGA